MVGRTHPCTRPTSNRNRIRASGAINPHELLYRRFIIVTHSRLLDDNCRIVGVPASHRSLVVVAFGVDVTRVRKIMIPGIFFSIDRRSERGFLRFLCRERKRFDSGDLWWTFSLSLSLVTARTTAMSHLFEWSSNENRLKMSFTIGWNRDFGSLLYCLFVFIRSTRTIVL